MNSNSKTPTKLAAKASPRPQRAVKRPRFLDELGTSKTKEEEGSTTTKEDEQVSDDKVIVNIPAENDKFEQKILQKGQTGEGEALARTRGQERAKKSEAGTPVVIVKQEVKRRRKIKTEEGEEATPKAKKQSYPPDQQIEFELGETNKGGMCVWREGFRYVRNHRERSYWRCSHKKCLAKAKVTLCEDGIPRGNHQADQHNHPAENERQEAERLRAEIKRKIKEEPGKINKSQILNEVRASATDEKCVEAMGNQHALRQMMQRISAKRPPVEGAKKKKAGQERFYPVDEYEFELGKTNMDGICVWRDGFRYVRNHKVYWRCTHKKCPAKAKVIIGEDGIPRGSHRVDDHDHPAENERQEAEKLRNEIKRKIKDQPWISPARMLGEVRAIAPDEKCLAAMGNDHALLHMMQRTARKTHGKANKRDVLEMVFDDELVFKDNANTLIYDSRQVREGEKDVVLVFSHPQLLDVLQQNPRWSVGSTTQLPRPFTNCMVMGAFIGNTNKMAICAWALIVGKQKKNFVEALNAVKASLGEVYPQSVISDFDLPLLGAIKTVFPDIPLSGCNFGQKLWRKFYNLKMDKLLWEIDAQIGYHVRETFKRILSLPLLPPNEVRRAFALIIDSAPVQMTDFLHYFAQVYIGLTDIEVQLGSDAFKPGIMMREKRTLYSESGVPTIYETFVPRWSFPITQVPKYPIEFWNHGEHTAKALTLINNFMGGQFLRDLKFRPSMSDFVLAIQAEMDAQLGIAQSAATAESVKNQPGSSPRVIQEQKVITILNRAHYDHDASLLNLLTLLGMHVQGCVPALLRKKKKPFIKREVKTENGVQVKKEVKQEKQTPRKTRNAKQDETVAEQVLEDGDIDVETEEIVQVEDDGELVLEMDEAGDWADIYDEEMYGDIEVEEYAEEAFQQPPTDYVGSSHQSHQQVVIPKRSKRLQQNVIPFDHEMPSTSAAAAAAQPHVTYSPHGTRTTHLIIK